MASRVEKVAVFLYRGEIHRDAAEVKRALRRDIIAERIGQWEAINAKEYEDAIGAPKPCLAEYLAEAWDKIEQEIGNSMAGTGL